MASSPSGDLLISAKDLLVAAVDGKGPDHTGIRARPGQVKQSGSTLIFGPSYSASRRAEHFLLTSIVSYSWMVIFWTRPARAVTLQGPTTTASPINGIRSQSTSVSGRVVQTTVATSREGHRLGRVLMNAQNSSKNCSLRYVKYLTHRHGDNRASARRAGRELGCNQPLDTFAICWGGQE